MEFLDPKKRKQHLIRLTIGYVLIGLAVGLTALILLYQAYGFGLKNGQVIQNGLVFVSSNPNPADIYINNEKHQEQTNARLLLPAGQYGFELKRDGYAAWKRSIAIEGGSVSRFDYPMLFPSSLSTTSIKKYDTQPGLLLHSPDRRWIMVQNGTSLTAFDVYDANDPERAATSLALPASLYALPATGTHKLELLEWSSDNRHVLLRHTAEDAGKTASEYVLIDREEPAQSVNLTKTLGINPTKLELRDKKFDQYYVYTATGGTLQTASIKEPQPKTLLSNVTAYKSHGADRLLYVTTEGATAGKAMVRLREGDTTYTVRQVALDTTYLLQIARYSGDWLVAVGAPGEHRTYVYKNVVDQLRQTPGRMAAPVHVLKVRQPGYLAFSDNARFIMAHNATDIGVYDAENDKGYTYRIPFVLDAPQEHLTWMDGHRLLAVSKGKAVVFEFDNANRATLSSSLPAHLPAFDRDYRFLYTLTAQTATATDGKQTTSYSFGMTHLRTSADQ